MSDRNYTPTRRSTLKGLTGAIVGVAGFSAVAAGADSDDVRLEPAPDAGDGSQWVLELENGALSRGESAGVSANELKVNARESQTNLVQTLESTEGVSVRKQFWITNAVLVEIDDESDLEPTDTFRTMEDVTDVHPNFWIEGPEPADVNPMTALEDESETTYGLEQISAPRVWEAYENRGEGTRVAVLDTGIDPDHPAIDLAEDGWAEFDEEGNEIGADPNDAGGHGTHVSGTVAGGDPDGIHIGVAPETELYHGKVLDGGGTFAQIIGGIEWAVDNDADVINMSLGAEGYVPEMIEPVRAAKAAGTLVVSSSGNSGPDTSGSPANVYDNFAIGATDPGEAVADFSSGELIYSEEAWAEADEIPAEWPTWYTVPNVAAPGVDVLSAAPGGGYVEMSGTSMASPHAAGIAALALSADPDLTPTDIEEAIEGETVHPEGQSEQDTRYGYGITDVFRAVTALEHDGVVTGTVTDSDDEPVAGLTVWSEFGTYDVTDEDGTYTLPCPNGETTVQGQAFGIDTGAETVTVDGETTVDLTAADVLDVRPQQTQPIDMAAGDTRNLVLDVANLEALAVDFGEDTDGISAEDIRLEVAGETFQPGESITFDEPLTEEAVTLSVTVEYDEVIAYAGEDDTVGTDGLRNAIDDWRSDDIETTLLRDVIDAWRSDETVSDGDTDLDGTQFELVHTFSGLEDEVQVGSGTTEVFVNPDPPMFEITDPNFDEVIGADRELLFSPTIENTGGLADSQDVLMYISLGDVEAAFGETIQLERGEDTTLELPIAFGSDFPRTQGTQAIHTDDDTAEGTFEYHDSDIQLLDADAPEAITVGDTLEIDVTYENVGELPGGDQADFMFNDRSASTKDLEAPAGDEATRQFTLDTDGLPSGTYEYIVALSEEDALGGEITIER